jgi:CHAD domain-containing protein
MLAMGHLVEVLLWHAPAAHAGTKPEGVHQMRVAMRRLRSLLRAFRPACDGPSLRGFDAALKELAGVLGPARDWDVWIGGLGAEIAAALPEEPRIAALLRAARAKRDAAYAALRPVLDGPALRRVAWQAVALAETRPWRAESEPERRRAARPPAARFRRPPARQALAPHRGGRDRHRRPAGRGVPRAAHRGQADALRRRAVRAAVGAASAPGASWRGWRRCRRPSASPTTPSSRMG